MQSIADLENWENVLYVRRKEGLDRKKGKTEMTETRNINSL